ncbi:MAG TPA: hypothetical protein VMV83_13480 [Rectinemataceae bacterium]|nr:hypothetical protein [Rectinemataceae bacterium]
MISRPSALGLGLLLSAIAAFAMVTPLWYLATKQRPTFNLLVASLLAFVVAASLIARVMRSRREKRRKTRAGIS